MTATNSTVPVPEPPPPSFSLPSALELGAAEVFCRGAVVLCQGADPNDGRGERDGRTEDAELLPVSAAVHTSSRWLAEAWVRPAPQGTQLPSVPLRDGGKTNRSEGPQSTIAMHPTAWCDVPVTNGRLQSRGSA